jgi:prepilin-type N-terminal cleavage/methylation domain-containing protein
MKLTHGHLRGVTLVELLVSVAIGLILMVAVSNVVDDNYLGRPTTTILAG